ncbi:glycoside hydrolase family 88 protein [Paraglaciecola aquimarina]|uniref:Glycoside hydrolase family 88 protein n=1 Tax=Paraglaciecola algarum TaxID=3050085 RepID=A0ABS9DDB0_9ALTE|nr:glycoside hydrolase family 88 protein [Paraglaciecola sp. G1-23]MCF2950342.1 glycoside hydrolase family 88 protein [Paraglaciecola sp. G1-23]
MSSLLFICLMGCGEQANKPQETSSIDVSNAHTNSKQSAPKTDFDTEQAKSNLVFIKDQYLKMIDVVDSNQQLKWADTCLQIDSVCFPRALEHDQIYMEKLTKWTNGFYPGVFWKILSVTDQIDGFSQEQQTKMFDKATFYQAALLSETKRGTTHDLGFLLYDSFGEALHYANLPKDTRALYEQALQTGRDTLATRYDPSYGLIKSWDWKPLSLINYEENGTVLANKVPVANPWEFPVIVDNMMNLEFMFESSEQAHRELAFSHAKQTLKNHYFYTSDDTEQAFPIAYHVYEYGSQRPGNWQGLGNVSAWARGQGWSLYGFVNVIEALKKQAPEMQVPDFERHVERLVDSVVYLLDGEAVPHWDYFATQENAAVIAADQSKDTYRFSRILDLCDFLIEDDILPYVGYSPITVDKEIYSESALAFMQGKKSAYGQALIQGDSVLPCGASAYKNLGHKIPKDTSAAALYASALYRLAIHTDKAELKQTVVQLADKIMAALSQDYLTSKHKNKDYDLGFVLTEATGNLPNASEINTSIVYADFYFIEANILKIQLSTTE